MSLIMAWGLRNKKKTKTKKGGDTHIWLQSRTILHSYHTIIITNTILHAFIVNSSGNVSLSQSFYFIYLLFKSDGDKCFYLCILLFSLTKSLPHVSKLKYVIFFLGLHLKAPKLFFLFSGVYDRMNRILFFSVQSTSETSNFYLPY